ncbi:MAG: response regulator [Oscillospiraceae bacterium]|nr:response regulator [Oscillospiraceae bacterium]
MRSQCTALIVDDNLISRSIIEEMLADFGIKCISTDNGVSALELLSDEIPDIIFTDHVMPIMDGIELCGRIRDMKGEYAEIPIILMTGNNIDDYKELYIKAGFNDWLVKPVEPRELESVLPARKTVVKKGVSSGVMGVFVEHTREVIPKMDKYLSSNELKLYSIEAHSLKSNLKCLGSDDLADCARELEKLADSGATDELILKHSDFKENVLIFTDKVADSMIEESQVYMEYGKKKRTILAVDDNPVNLHMLTETLRDDYNIATEPSGARALEYLSKTLPDLILIDIKMPVMDGYDVVDILKRDLRFQSIPIIFLTGSESVKDEARAFEVGAVDFIKKPIEPVIVLARVKLHLELELYRKSLEKVVLERTRKLEHTSDAILRLLANVASHRDEETGTHIQRTTDYVELLIYLIQRANLPGYGISKSYGESIIKSAKLHDIGKVAISDNILLKPGKLTPEEFDTMKFHTTEGAHMIDDAIKDLHDNSMLRVGREIIIGHHERWDGTGYPHGIKGDAIPISARIMAIADVYDALISERPYKKAFSHEKASEIIISEIGTHFDPVIIGLLKDHMDELEKILKRHRDDSNDNQGNDN